MTLSTDDLFGHQHHTWATCPDLVQTIIFKNICQTIKARIEKEHSIGSDYCEGFTDDGAAVTAEVQSQLASLPPFWTPQIQSQLSSRLPAWDSMDSQSNIRQPAYWDPGVRPG